MVIFDHFALFVSHVFRQEPSAAERDPLNKEIEGLAFIGCRPGWFAGVRDRICSRAGRPLGYPGSRTQGKSPAPVTMAAAVKARIDAWLAAAKISEGKVFRP
jgi:hypothetical protein